MAVGHMPALPFNPHGWNGGLGVGRFCLVSTLSIDIGTCRRTLLSVISTTPRSDLDPGVAGLVIGPYLTLKWLVAFILCVMSYPTLFFQY